MLTKKWQKMKMDVWPLCRKSTDFLRTVIAPVGGMGGVTLSHICPHCNSFPFGEIGTFGGYRRGTETAERRSTAVGGVRCVEANYEWSTQQGSDSAARYIDADEAKVFRAHAAPQGL